MTNHTPSHGSSFDIKTPSDFLRKIVIPQYEDFVAANSSSRHALLAIVVAYHMYDWVHQTHFTVEHFRTTYQSVEEVCSLSWPVQAAW